jgi:pimeloyl-ACP methyl ester carboxylesterase
VIVDQPPSDFAWPDYEWGFFTPQILDETLEGLLRNPGALIEMLVAMVLHEPQPADSAWMRADPKLTSPDAGRYIAQRIPGAQLELFEGSSHALFWEQHERFNAVLEAFLARMWP